MTVLYGCVSVSACLSELVTSFIVTSLSLVASGCHLLLCSVVFCCVLLCYILLWNQIIGQCTDMCPPSERSRGGNNPRKIDVLEESLDLSVSALAGEEQSLLDHRHTMIKKYEKSSADRNMAQPEIVRTPATLLNTLQFMEQNVMDVDRQVVLTSDEENEDVDENENGDTGGDGPSKYHVHNFIWVRAHCLFSSQLYSALLAKTCFTYQTSLLFM